MPSLKAFRQMSGLPDSIRRWSDAAEQVKAGQKALVEQAVPVSGWRPIESAPKDGDTQVLLYVRWKDAHSTPSHTIWCHDVIVGIYDEGRWVSCVDSDTPFNNDLPALLWQPMPEMPQPTELAQGLTPPNSEAEPDTGIPATEQNQRVTPMANGINVDWRAVSHNAPSRDMPRSVPWVHGLIREAKGPSPRIELAPKRREGDRYPVHLIMAHPDQPAAEAMDWDASLTLTVDGHEVALQKSMGPAYGWCEPEPWALVAELDADHPLVIHAAEAAKAPQEAREKAQDDFYAAAREWGDANFPHPDFMNVVRSLMLSEWQHAPGYWPGDPLPDVTAICEKAREQIRG